MQFLPDRSGYIRKNVRPILFLAARNLPLINKRSVRLKNTNLNRRSADVYPNTFFFHVWIPSLTAALAAFPLCPHLFSALALIIRNASPFCKVWKAKYTCLPEKGAFLLKRYRILFCRQTGACLLSYFFTKISIISGS